MTLQQQIGSQRYNTGRKQPDPVKGWPNQNAQCGIWLSGKSLYGGLQATNATKALPHQEKLKQMPTKTLDLML
jgi:hypothetical protein